MLDLRRDGSLSIEDAKKITSIQTEVGIEYTEYIQALVVSNKISDFQWLLQITSRNTYATSVYDSMCRLRFLESILKEGRKVSNIKIDNPLLEAPIIQILDEHQITSKIEIVNSKKSINFQLTRNLIKNLYICLCQWLGSLLFKNKNLPDKSLYLLDSFVMNKSFDQNYRLIDRYYPGLIDNLPIQMKPKVWNLLTISSIKYPWEWLNTFYKVSKSKNNIILKEYWLSYKDYFYAIYNSIFLVNSIKKIPKWGYLDISTLVLEELNKDRGSSSISQGILMYIFFKKLKKNQIQILGVIDWFENQIIDRGLYLGMKKFFPETLIKGYLGFIPEDYYIGAFPTTYEKQFNLLPDELIVVGEAYIDKVQKFCPDMKVNSGPAFRFTHVFDYKNTFCDTRNIILLALPMKIEEIRRIFNVVSKVELDRKYRLIIKAHPTTNIMSILKSVPNLNNSSYEISDLPVDEILQTTRLVITSASSIALEALCCGVYVAIIGNRSGPTINRLSGFVDNKYWSICYTSSDITSLINSQNTKVELDLKKYFHPVDKKSTLKMMTF